MDKYYLLKMEIALSSVSLNLRLLQWFHIPVAHHLLLSTSCQNKQKLQGWEALLEAMKKARRLNNHVFSMLKSRCPLEEKTACAIKQSGAPLHRIRFENTVSAFETLPQEGA